MIIGGANQHLSVPSELLDEIDGDGAALAERVVVPVLQHGNRVLWIHLKERQKRHLLI